MSLLHLFVPGAPDAATGGYIYDREVLAGLRGLGWATRVHALDASFPQPTAAALRDARERLDALADGSLVVVDGLALAGLERLLGPSRERLELVALIHHPLALETGLPAAVAQRLRAAERQALAAVRRVIVTSRWTAGALLDYGVPLEKIHVAEPGVHAVERSAARREHATPSLLCVGTVTARKGHAVLVEALGDIRDRRWHLTCVGSLVRDAACARALEQQIERLRLRERISLLGELDAAALERHYARADLFVLASHLEGYGMALAEALAHGIPVVSTTAGAVPSTVPAGAGVLVPPGDSRALAHALARLLDDPAERAALAARARAFRARSWQVAARDFAAALAGLGAPA
jgi:glycosyltransferase involved in cell wall biosynthesis